MFIRPPNVLKLMSVPIHKSFEQALAGNEAAVFFLAHSVNMHVFHNAQF